MFVKPVNRFLCIVFLKPRSLNSLVSSSFSKRGKVRFLLIENKIMNPITEPRVDARITPIRVNFVPLTKKPPSVKITSEGIGGENIFNGN